MKRAVCFMNKVPAWSNIYDGLVSWYKLDIDSSDSNGTNDGTDTAISYATLGKIGYGASFNGTTSYINLGTNSSLSFTGDFSISAWVKPTTLSAQALIIGKSQSGSTYPQYTLNINQNSNNQKAYFSVNGNIYSGSPSAFVESSVTISTGVFTHIVAVRDGTNIIIYVDGINRGSTAWTNNQGASSEHVEMGSVDSSGTKFQKLNGMLDEVAIYNIALTADKVTELYNGGSGITL